MKCTNCGGDMIGDGVKCIMICETLDMGDFFDLEADSKPVYCIDTETVDLQNWRKNDKNTL